MSFRISFYKLPKDKVGENATDADVAKLCEPIMDENGCHCGYPLPENNLLECVAYDTSTDVYFDNVKEPTRLLTNLIPDDPDIIIGIVSRDQLVNWIKDCEGKHKKYLEHYLTNSNGDSEYKFDPLSDFRYRLGIANISDIEDFLNEPQYKYKVSPYSGWSDAMFNFVALYRFFDFKNNYLIVYGG